MIGIWTDRPHMLSSVRARGLEDKDGRPLASDCPSLILGKHQYKGRHRRGDSTRTA